MPTQVTAHLLPLQSESADGRVVREILAGHHEAFDILFQRYHHHLFVFIRRYLKDYDLACDIAQSVFIQLYLSLPTLRLDTPLKGWLYQVARHRCLDELRRKYATPFSQMEIIEEQEESSPLAILQDTTPLPEELVEQREERAIIRRAIEDLPSRYRMVILLRYTKQFSFFEVGQTLNIPECTAKTYFYRALPRLRRALVILREACGDKIRK